MPYLGGDAIAVSAGGVHNCVLFANGNVHCWGADSAGDPSANHGQAAPYEGGDAIAVSAGGQNTCVLLATHKDVQCWGSNDYGQSAGYASTDGTDVMALEAGGDRTCVLLSSRNVRCWGSAWYDFGQYVGYSGGDAVAMSIGTFHSCVLRLNGNVYCWGGNDKGQTAPYLGGNAVAVGAGGKHTCALLATRNVVCWGIDNSGYSGGDAVALSVSGDHNCVLLPDGAVKCWGNNSEGYDPAFTSACSDQVDNDLDGYTDYPGDPGCSSVTDNDEGEDSTTTTGPIGPLTVGVEESSSPTVPPQTISTPEIPPYSVVTPQVPIPQTCSPAGVICAGPFTIPSLPIVTTPGIPGQSFVTTPGVEGVPLTPTVTFSVATAGFEILVEPHLGEFGSTGPMTVLVPTPFGPFPVELCAEGCFLPVLPEGGIDGSVTVTISIGSQTVSTTVPVRLP